MLFIAAVIQAARQAMQEQSETAAKSNAASTPVH